jgi:glycine betaine/choline ABC-type transport system substrate-binding protein
MLAHQALLAGGIDVYPEYTGTALTAILKLPISSDPQAVYKQVAAEYQSRWKALWLPPLGFNDTFAMVISGEVARKEGIKTLSQAAQRKEGWQLGVGYEFLQRPDGLPGLQKTYPLTLKAAPRTMDLGLLHKALQQGQVEMVAANSTDGLLAVLDLTVLEDDKRFFPPYEAAFVLGERLWKNDGARLALEELSGKLDTVTMRKLNFEVDGKHRRPAEVVTEFLAGLGPKQ